MLLKEAYKILALAVLEFHLLGPTLALAARAVCSGFAQNANDPSKKMAVSIDFFDQRSGANARKYTLSSIYQLKLW
jgi:hypothetical protein